MAEGKAVMEVPREVTAGDKADMGVERPLTAGDRQPPLEVSPVFLCFEPRRQQSGVDLLHKKQWHDDEAEAVETKSIA